MLTIVPLTGRANFGSDARIKRREIYGKLALPALLVGFLCALLLFVSELWFFFECDGLWRPNLGNPSCALSYDTVLDVGWVGYALVGLAASIGWVLLGLAAYGMDSGAHSEANVALPEDLKKALRAASNRLLVLRRQKRQKLEAKRKPDGALERLSKPLVDALGNSLGGPLLGMAFEAATATALEGQPDQDRSVEDQIRRRYYELLWLVVRYNRTLREGFAEECPAPVAVSPAPSSEAR